MSVYVDSAMIVMGRMRMSHMIADTTEELLEMADRIGVQRRWIQKPGTAWEHFDISAGMRAKAIAFGAIEITSRDLVRKIHRRRGIIR